MEFECCSWSYNMCRRNRHPKRLSSGRTYYANKIKLILRSIRAGAPNSVVLKDMQNVQVGIKNV